jgi:hypothetical protein
MGARSTEAVDDRDGADARATLYASAAFRRMRRLRAEHPTLSHEIDALAGEIVAIVSVLVRPR